MTTRLLAMVVVELIKRSKFLTKLAKFKKYKNIKKLSKAKGQIFRTIYFLKLLS